MRRQSLVRKLVFLVMTAVASGMAVSALLATWQEVERYADARRQLMLATARVFAAATARPVAELNRQETLEAIRAMAEGLPAVLDKPRDVAARAKALYGAWLCGTVLGSVGMALHHKLCHVLGGSFDLPHAETHTVVLPHVVSFNTRAVPEQLAPVAEILRSADPGQRDALAQHDAQPETIKKLHLRPRHFAAPL